MKIHKKINDIYIKNANYCYDFDLFTGIVEKDIIDKNGINFTKGLGLTSPCTFDELMERSFCNDFLKVCDIYDEKCEFNKDYLINAYKNGIDFIEKTFYSSLWDIYSRIDYFIVKNEKTNKPHVYVYAYDISKTEKMRENVYGILKKSKLEIDDIVASAQIGIWHIYLYDDKKPRLKVSPKMFELLGLEKTEMDAKELYELWHKNIKQSSRHSVEENLKKMIENGFEDFNYTWIHPKNGEIFVHCGGSAIKVDGKGYVLRGYHIDITNIVNKEIKQKKLLEQALEEVKKQKTLLQIALDNYKEADYDRRRDFLTGLRNRQDMFEMLKDDLSEKRKHISAMFLLDIDDFKKINDYYGHSYGDETLKKISHSLKEYGKKNNLYFYRYGGEEILAIAFETKKDAKIIAKEIVELIFNLKIEHKNSKFGFVTISLGYTIDNLDCEKMIDKADIAMYRAKQHGKNQFVCFEEIKD